MLNKVLTKVDFPNPDSPDIASVLRTSALPLSSQNEHTDNHCREGEALADTSPMDLIREVCETHITRKLLPYDRWYTGGERASSWALSISVPVGGRFVVTVPGRVI